MNNIQKSFLYSAARKIVPFQLMKTNYGFSSADGDDVTRELAAVDANLQGFKLVSLPQSASFVAFAIKLPAVEDVDQSLRVVSIGTSPLGETELSLQLQPGVKHYIYIMSNKHDDGYIDQVLPNPGLVAEDVFAVDTADPSRFRREFILASPTDRVEVTLVLSQSENESDWYPYEGKYDRDFLLWADPTPLFTVSEGIRPQGNYSYLAYQLAFLETLLNNFLDAFDLQGATGRRVFEDQFVNSLQQLDPLNPTPISLREALAAQYGLTRSVLVLEDWEDDTRLINTEAGANTVNAISSTMPSEYRSDVHSLIGAGPVRSTPTDNTLQYNMASAPEQLLAGYVVILNYVVAAYDTSTASFNQDFRRGINSPAPSGIARNRQRALASSTREAIFGSGAEDRFNSETAPVMFDHGREVLDDLRNIVGNSTSSNEEAIGAQILEYVDIKTSEYAQAFEASPTFNRMYIDPFGTTSALIAIGRIRENIGARAQSLVLNILIPSLDETNRFITNLGDFTFIPPPEGEDDGEPPLAHEATLQNIRFLRNLIEETRDDLWAQSVNFNNFIVNAIINLRDEAIADLRRSNTVVNITHTTQLSNTDIDVLYRSTTAQSGWQRFNGQILEYGNGVMALDMSFLQNPGQYVFLIRPQGLDIVVKSIPAPGVIQTPSLDNFQSKNYFYGWNIEFSQAGSNGLPLGEQRMIVGSDFSPGASSLVVSPNIVDRPDFTVDINARIWPNAFIPVLIDVDVVEHTTETLAYANYAKREFNTTTGVLTLYDFAGNVYKKWTVGERTLEQEDFANIDFREPIE